MRGPRLELDAVSAGYGGTSVIEAVSFAVASGDRLGIIGRNGAGKTTTLACVVGLADRIAGSIRFDGNDIGDLPTFRRAQAGLGLVPQTRDIFPSLTVEENLLSALPKRTASARLSYAYDLFPRLKERHRNGGTQLSGGEQQMLAVARALVAQPRILLLDEPLEGLAPRIRAEVMSAIDRLVTETGIGCVLVEQHVDVVLAFAAQVLVLERGKPVFHGTREALRQQQGILDRAIGLGRRIDGNVAARQPKDGESHGH